ncbi:extensin-like domain-containing protein [Roseomonas marmotae]|uniref:Extensin family protein n=1 Tax=Roseomonas marmotae TaxID=2768161 RepID=A0ABS3K9Y2_9PROT|nr:extensin family protein [Roseomonas marmotae]MBO1073745.1 extensin family protein [Roseomonas marmotae]QTI78623.1 extensin family protein [Roseomonas marmotae]
MIRRLLLTLLLLAPLALVGGYLGGVLRLPPEWDPRAPLDFRAEPNLMTRWKLARIKIQPEACFAAFAASGLSPQRLPDREAAEGCPLVDTMRLEGESAVLSPARPVVTCPVAAAWLMFERHALQPAARAHFDSHVTGVRHLGSFACRNVYGRAAGRRSQHASANAIDIAGFTLANGREVRLPRDWGGEDAPAAFLRDVRDGACRFFGAVLGPEYNAAHRDHFHMEQGRWRRCS